MLCSKCGFDLSDYTSFCANCGFSLVNEDYNKIETIRASVGGYPHGQKDVIIDLKNLRITLSSSFSSKEIKEIDTSAAKEFIEQLRKLDLFSWKSKYDSRILDGTQWSVDIFNGTSNINKYGSNSFPAEWNMFCELISDISKTEFYIKRTNFSQAFEQDLSIKKQEDISSQRKKPRSFLRLFRKKNQ